MRRAVVLIALVVGLAAARLPSGSLARLTATGSIAGSSLAAGSWVLYLHNAPTPPTAATKAQFGLTMTTTTSTQATLQNYDSDCDSVAGRELLRGTALATESGLCKYANWRTSVYAAARPLKGTVTLRIWCRKTGTGGTNPTLTAYLRDYNPATTTYVELGSAAGAVVTNSGTAFAQLALTWTLSTSVAAGDQLELKLVAGGGSLDANLAYDTTTQLSRLVLLQQPAT